MKKKLIIAGASAAVLIAVIIAVLVLINGSKPDKNTELVNISEDIVPVSTNEIEETEIGDYKARKPETAQLGLIVDSWLKIINIGETDGVLSVVVRNTADFDVRYALLTVSCDGEKLSFPMTTVTAGSTSVLKTDTGAEFDKKASYVGWQIEEKTLFDSELSLCEDIFEISACDELISVKNISDSDITGSIYVYYKNVENGIFSEGTTYRIGIDTLASGEKIQVEAEHYSSSASKVMFVTYVQ